jgi:hypothetical protein
MSLMGITESAFENLLAKVASMIFKIVSLHHPCLQGNKDNSNFVTVEDDKYINKI